MCAARSLVLFVALLVGCGAAQTGEPAAPAASSTTSYLVKEANLVNGAVSVHLDIPLEPSGRKPAVIALLGDTHAIVAAGFVAVTYTVRWGVLRMGQPTPSPAEQAVGKWVLASPSADVLGERYLHEIASTAEMYVPAVLDWLVTQPEVDPERLGMVGSSTNGFVTLQAVAADRRLTTAVAIAACGDYHRFLQFSEMGMAGKPLQLAPAYADWVRGEEVIHHPDRLTHAAVLMINRSADPLIPVSCADETARVLTEAFARAGVPQRFRFIRLDGEGHGMAAPEIDATMAWLKEWLGGP